jgi:hypothetical protein
MVDTTKKKGVWVNWEAQKFVQICAGEFKTEHNKSSTTDMMVCLAVVRHFPEGKMRGWVIQENLAYEARCNERTVRRSLERLHEAGILLKLTPKAKKGKAWYKLNLTQKQYEDGEEYIRKLGGEPDLLPENSHEIRAISPGNKSNNPGNKSKIAGNMPENLDLLPYEERQRRDDVEIADAAADARTVNQEELTNEPEYTEKEIIAMLLNGKPLAELLASIENRKRVKTVNPPTPKFPGPNVKSAAKPPEASSPSQEFATWYWMYIGSRDWEETHARSTWTSVFLSTVEKYGVVPLREAITWYDENHGDFREFYPRFRNSHESSAQYLVDHIDYIFHKRANAAERSHKKRKASPSSEPSQISSHPVIRPESHFKI